MSGVGPDQIDPFDPKKAWPPEAFSPKGDVKESADKLRVELGPQLAHTMTVDEMFRRVRAHHKVTRNSFKGQLRRAEKDGLLVRDGIRITLTDAGVLAMGKELVKVDAAA